jgi:hypothetical protein
MPLDAGPSSAPTTTRLEFLLHLHTPSRSLVSSGRLLVTNLARLPMSNTRVIVRLPYNRPEHAPDDPAPVGARRAIRLMRSA